LASRPITVWCSNTKFNTLPSEYRVFFDVTASSIASLIAIAKLPGVLGISFRIWRPAFVSSLGLPTHFAPHTRIIIFRNGFWSKLIRTM
jgi:hypothetical protein